MRNATTTSFCPNELPPRGAAPTLATGPSPFPKGEGCRRRGGGLLRRAFTLIELLVVIAITVVLFALLLRPLTESLRLTQSAQIQAAAQDSARTTMERITRELGSAVYVYDNASHPFSYTGALTAGKPYDKFTNFLDLPVTKSDGTQTVEHAYNAKLDLVPARHLGGGLTDPTTGQPIQVSKSGAGSGVVGTSGLLFPLAPGGTIIRYFVGLKDPTKPYTNSNEGLLAAASANGDNTYVLYVAQVSPYNSSGTAKNADGTTINELLFAPMHDSKGVVVNKPELDDPDFFRYVSATDVNWLDALHASYPGQTPGTPTPDGTPAQHNFRADNWAKLAKTVITAPDIDLLLLPHNPDGSIQYDAAAGTLPNVAHSGVTYDPVKDASAAKPIPTVNTSVTFRPAVIEADAAPGTTSDYSAQGVPANAADNGGLPYIPTLYTASSQSWAYPYQVSLYPQYASSSTGSYDPNKPFFHTDLDRTGQTQDIIEYRCDNAAAATDTGGTGVFDVTTGTPLANANGLYVPFTVNPDSGTLNFAMPALPHPPMATGGTDAGDAYARFWQADPAGINGGTLLACPLVDPTAGPTSPRQAGVVDLTQLFCDPGSGVLTTTGGTNTSPLPPPVDLTKTSADTVAPSGFQVAYAHVVPGSVRVYGPDASPGVSTAPDSAFGKDVLYSPVSPGTPLSYNQYRVDTLNSRLYFYVDASEQLPTTTTDASNNKYTADFVKISFDYQSNLAPIGNAPQTSLYTAATGTGAAITPSNPAQPMLVKVDYQTRDLIEVNIGVRIYDTSQGRAVIVPATNRVQIGNSNR